MSTHDEVTRVSVAVTERGYKINWPSYFCDGRLIFFRGAAKPGQEQPLVEGALNQAQIIDSPNGVHQVFYLQPRSGSAGLAVALRALPLAGGVNFRDIGGYQTADGRRVKWGRVFRSGHMSKLTRGDYDYLSQIGLKTVCDLRLPEEAANESAATPHGAKLEFVGIRPGVSDPRYFHRLFQSANDPQVIVEAMATMNCSLMLDMAPNYQRLLDMMLDAGNAPLLINCSAGKERTGVAVAILLTALGVPRETVLYDFMLSKTYFPVAAEVERVKAKYEVTDSSPAATALVMPLLETHETYLESAFAAMEAKYGNSANYLREMFGLDNETLAALKEIYTA
ncbi:MAG: tyrosine-protein phosphatase [Pseudomonadota bacterium]